MIKIINDAGLTLQLNDNDVITVDKNGVLFNAPDQLVQDVSYPGKADRFNEANILFFKYGNLIESSNAVYVMPVKFYAGTDLFLTGNIKYRVGPDAFEYNLEPNLVAILSLLRNIKLSDIRATDAYVNFTADQMATLMKDTCVNPNKYPFHFFPVYNGAINVPIVLNPFQEVNHWDSEAEQFITFDARAGYALLSPYYKLTYMLKQIAGYLGLTPKGGVFTDEKFKSICIYTREFFIALNLLTSNRYMPGMLITDFIKQIRERLHIAIDFDLNTNTMEIETFRSIYESEAIDISQYINVGIEQEIPDQTGATVTLKSDQEDDLFQVSDGTDTPIYPALYQLISGDGSTPTELDCSTLKKSTDISGGISYPGRTLATTQLLYNGPQDSNFEHSRFTGSNDYNDYNTWPLRVMRWLGYNQLSSGKYYPEAGPLELDEDDVLFYRFANDSKRLIIPASIPPSVLAGMKTTRKYCFKTPGYNYTEIIIEKISYDIGPTTELVPVKIYGRTLNFSVNTPVAITPVGSAVDADFTRPDGSDTYIQALVKAYFDPLLHGIMQLDFEVVCTSGDMAELKCKPVTIPANIKGSGGAPAGVYLITGGIGTDPSFRQEIRIRRGHPQYLLFLGKRTDFTLSPSGYYYVEVSMGSGAFEDYYTIFF